MVVLRWFKNRILHLKNRFRGCSSSDSSCAESQDSYDDSCDDDYYERILKPRNVIDGATSNSYHEELEHYSNFYCPDEILIEILSRVPADRLEVFKRVCRCWRVLISSYHLSQLHLERAQRDEEAISSPLFFVQHTPNEKNQKIEAIWLSCGRSVEGWRHPGFVWKSRDVLKKHVLIGSCDGLLVFLIREKPCSKSLIVNPVTQETRLITNPHDTTDSIYSCCIFFDQFEDDYKILHIYPGRIHPMYDDYIYSFNRNVWERIDHVKTHHLFIARYNAPPARVADALHWAGDDKNPCSKRVLVFKIESKEFFFLPYPRAIKTDIDIDDNCCLSPDDDVILSDESMQLIEKNGQLGLCHTIRSSKFIDIWILEEYGNWQSWVRKFKVDLLFVGANHFGSRQVMWEFERLYNIKIVSCKDDDILLVWDYIWFYLHTPGTNKLKLIFCDGSYNLVPFTRTLVSPNNVYTTLTITK